MIGEKPILLFYLHKIEFKYTKINEHLILLHTFLQTQIYKNYNIFSFKLLKIFNNLFQNRNRRLKKCSF